MFRKCKSKLFLCIIYLLLLFVLLLYAILNLYYYTSILLFVQFSLLFTFIKIFIHLSVYNYRFGQSYLGSWVYRIRNYDGLRYAKDWGEPQRFNSSRTSTNHSCDYEVSVRCVLVQWWYNRRAWCLVALLKTKRYR